MKLMKIISDNGSCSGLWLQFRSNEYWISLVKADYATAAADCIAKQAYLAVINSTDEMHALKTAAKYNGAGDT